MNIFLCEPIDELAYQKLQSHFHIINQIEELHLCDCIITRNIQVNKEMIDCCPHLQLIVVHGSGVDDVDITYAQQKNIKVVNTPGLNALSVAEMNIALMLNISRKVSLLHHDKKNHIFNEVAPITYMGSELSYKTVGFVGYGTIAKLTAHMLSSAFSMQIQTYDPYLNDSSIKQCTLEELFQTSDYILVSCSLTEDNYHMIDHHLLSLMKSNAYIINTSRGAIINEDDLYQVLIHHQIAGAALDVLEDEPVPSTHPLLTLDHVIYTSHMGASTNEALHRVGMAVVNEIIHFFKN